MPTPEEMFEQGVVYFTIRKVKGGWTACKVQWKGDDLIREDVGEVGGKNHAIRAFKIAVERYWR